MESENIKDTNDIQEQIQSLDDYNNNTQDLITCGNCGNVWDGYAQCNCWQLNYEEQEELLEKAVPEQLLEKAVPKINEQLLENSESTLDTTTLDTTTIKS
jgi:hypothetical protein